MQIFYYPTYDVHWRTNSVDVTAAIIGQTPAVLMSTDSTVAKVTTFTSTGTLLALEKANALVFSVLMKIQHCDDSSKMSMQ